MIIKTNLNYVSWALSCGKTCGKKIGFINLNLNGINCDQIVPI